MKILLACMVLSACSYQSLEDRAASCGLTTDPACQDLWERVYRAEDRQARKEACKAPCKSGVRISNGYSCPCVSRAEFERMMRDLRL